MTAFLRARFGTVLLGIALLAPVPLAGQSLIGSRGLGLPMHAANARARALGGEGVGLLGGNLNPADLASSTGLLIPTVNFTMQPSWGTGVVGGESLTAKGTRFPLLGIAYPVGTLGGMVTLTFSSVMDQRWEAVEEGTEILEGIEIPVTNTFKSSGGIAAFTVGWAQRVGRTLSLAVSAGLHTGSVTRTYAREFDESPLLTDEIIPFKDGGKWQYQGPKLGIGASWDPFSVLRVAGSLDWSGDLDAKPTSDTRGAGESYAIPTVFRLGASGILTPRLSLNLGMSYSDWTAPEGKGLEPGTVAGGVWNLGGGLEWDASGLGGRTIPIRLGVRRSDLPFLFRAEKPREFAYTGGLGLNLTQADRFVLAAVDLAVERGNREAGDFKEEFWKGTITFRVSGW